MLRVGLTGDLGSGKSTVARRLAAHGAIVLSSDEMARTMMQPGEPVFAAILQHFGPQILAPDGTLDRRRLARVAFDPTFPRIAELNALVHPAVIQAQLRLLQTLSLTQPQAIVVVESALLFTTSHTPGSLTWRDRFDTVVLVTAPGPLKVARFVQRASNGRILSLEEQDAIETDARRRLATQTMNAAHTPECLVIDNSGDLAQLHEKTDLLWQHLRSVEQINPAQIDAEAG